MAARITTYDQHRVLSLSLRHARWPPDLQSKSAGHQYCGARDGCNEPKDFSCIWHLVLFSETDRVSGERTVRASPTVNDASSRDNNDGRSNGGLPNMRRHKAAGPSNPCANSIAVRPDTSNRQPSSIQAPVQLAAHTSRRAEEVAVERNNRLLPTLQKIRAGLQIWSHPPGEKAQAISFSSFPPSQPDLVLLSGEFWRTEVQEVFHLQIIEKKG